MIGMGVLTLPWTTSQAGLGLSAVGLVVLAYLSQTAIRLTILCQVAMFSADERKYIVSSLRASASGARRSSVTSRPSAMTEDLESYASAREVNGLGAAAQSVLGAGMSMARKRLMARLGFDGGPAEITSPRGSQEEINPFNAVAQPSTNACRSGEVGGESTVVLSGWARLWGSVCQKCLATPPIAPLPAGQGDGGHATSLPRQEAPLVESAATAALSPPLDPVPKDTSPRDPLPRIGHSSAGGFGHAYASFASEKADEHRATAVRMRMRDTGWGGM